MSRWVPVEPGTIRPALAQPEAWCPAPARSRGLPVVPAPGAPPCRPACDHREVLVCYNHDHGRGFGTRSGGLVLGIVPRSDPGAGIMEARAPAIPRTAPAARSAPVVRDRGLVGGNLQAARSRRRDGERGRAGSGHSDGRRGSRAPGVLPRGRPRAIARSKAMSRREGATGWPHAERWNQPRPGAAKASPGLPRAAAPNPGPWRIRSRRRPRRASR